jgi:hypothetical protein
MMIISSVTFAAVIERLKDALRLRNDKEVAEALRIKPNAFYNRRRLNSLPYEELVSVAEQNGVRTDWLFFGLGDAHRAPRGQRSGSKPNVEPASMGTILFELERALLEAGVVEPDRLEAAARKGILAAQIYNESYLIDDERKRKAAVQVAAKTWADAARLLAIVTKPHSDSTASRRERATKAAPPRSAAARRGRRPAQH